MIEIKYSSDCLLNILIVSLILLSASVAVLGVWLVLSDHIYMAAGSILIAVGSFAFFGLSISEAVDHGWVKFVDKNKIEVKCDRD